MSTQRLVLNGRVKAVTDQNKEDKAAPYGSVEGIANALVTDRYREIVLPEAFRKCKEAFMLNPVMALGHRIDADPQAGLPIGTVIELDQDAEGNTIFKGRFASSPVAQQVRQLYLDGDMRAFSVQFMIKGSRDPTEADILKWPQARTIITDIDLLEISCCVVPVNQESLATATRSITSPATPRPRALASSGAATMKKAMSDEAKKHLGKVKAHYDECVKSMTGVADALDELAEHKDEGVDASSIAHRMGAHLDLSRRAMKGMKSAHSDLKAAIGDEPVEDPDGDEDDDEADDEEDMTEEEQKAFGEKLKQNLAGK